MDRTPVDNRKRIFGYDAIKALAAFLVVLYHVGMVDMGYREGQYYYPTLVPVIWLVCACGVPLFFMVNGALTVNRCYDLQKTAVKIGRLVLVGVFWGIVAMCLYAWLKHDPSFFSLSSVNYYWFLFTLAMLYAVNYVLSLLPRWCRWVVVAALLICPFATNLAWDVVTLRDPETQIHSWRTGAFTLYGAVYLYAGDGLRGRRVNQWLLLASALMGLALLALESMAMANRYHHAFEAGNYCFPTYGALLLSIALFVWLRDWDPAGNSLFKRFISFLGNNVLGIYIFHLLLLLVIGNLVPQTHAFVHPLMAILIALAYTVAAAGISELIKHSPLAFLLRL